MIKIFKSSIIHLNVEVNMSKFSLIGIVILSIFLIELSSDAIITNYGHNSPYKLVNSFKFGTENPYNQDLTRVEQFLFNQTYQDENNAERLNRIEYQVFKKNFPTLNISQRMNNVLANYRGDYMGSGYFTSNTGNYTSPSFRNRIINRFIGQPTGFTPALSNSNFMNSAFGPSYNRSYYGSNGWGYHNSYNPTMTGAGIHILD